MPLIQLADTFYFLSDTVFGYPARELREKNVTKASQKYFGISSRAAQEKKQKMLMALAVDANRGMTGRDRIAPMFSTGEDLRYATAAENEVLHLKSIREELVRMRRQMERKLEY